MQGYILNTRLKIVKWESLSYFRFFTVGLNFCVHSPTVRNVERGVGKKLNELGAGEACYFLAYSRLRIRRENN